MGSLPPEAGPNPTGTNANGNNRASSAAAPNSRAGAIQNSNMAAAAALNNIPGRASAPVDFPSFLALRRAADRDAEGAM